MTVVVVLGMHRSGTSMVAGCLSKLGVHMGDNLLMDNQRENPTGYFEDRDFMKLNGDILMSVGCSWDRPPDPLVIDHVAAVGRPDIKKFLTMREKRGLPFWGWKDPRTVLTWPIYARYLPSPKVIIVRRNYKTILASLFRRENINRKPGRKWSSLQVKRLTDHYLFLLWEYRRSLGNQCLTVRYEDLVQTRDLRPILEYTGIRPTINQIDDALNHIRPELNRSEARIRSRLRPVGN